MLLASNPERTKTRAREYGAGVQGCIAYIRRRTIMAFPPPPPPPPEARWLPHRFTRPSVPELLAACAVRPLHTYPLGKSSVLSFRILSRLPRSFPQVYMRPS